MRRAEAVAEVMLLQRQHAKASGGHVVRGGTPHAPNAGDDYVIRKASCQVSLVDKRKGTRRIIYAGAVAHKRPVCSRRGPSVVPAFRSG